MSLTIKGVVVMLLGFLLSKVNMPLPNEQLASFVETGIVIVGALIAWYGRLRQGDINLFGFRKTM